MPRSYCSCSVGWVKEMFEQALDRPVEVRADPQEFKDKVEARSGIKVVPLQIGEVYRLT